MARIYSHLDIQERALIETQLTLGMSLEQIASTLARMPDPVRLSYETIYTALYTMPRGHLRSSLLALMRRRHRAKKTSSRQRRAQ